MKCPMCCGNAVGKVGLGQYYCWNCFIEFSIMDDEVHIYAVAEDGSLLAVNNEIGEVSDAI